MTDLSTKTVLVTGANAGLGFDAAAQFAERGYGNVILACRTQEKADATRERLLERTGRDIFSTLAVDVAEISVAQAAAEELIGRGTVIDALVLNAGLAATELKTTSDGVELTFAASLIGHHVITMRLLQAGLLAPEARIIIAGSEGARGDLPGMALNDYEGIAKTSFDGDLRAAFEALARGSQPTKYKTMDVYVTAKLFAAWWAAALARRLPTGMVALAVSPGSAPGTSFSRNVGFGMKYIMIPMMKVLGPLMGMAGSVSAGAKRYVDAAEFGPETNGRFYASPGKKLVGKLTVQEHPHFLVEEHQEAAWDTVVRLAGGATVKAVRAA